MIRTLLRVAVWLAAGAGGVSAAYWAFLNTPEATGAALGLSAALVVTMVALTGVVVNGAVLLAQGETFRRSLVRGARSVHWFLAVALPVVLIGWGLRRADAWVAANAGEISAWFIVRFNWADVAPLFTAERYLNSWLRWIVAPAGALAMLACLLRGGGFGTAVKAIPSAWRWRPLLSMTAAFAGFVGVVALAGGASSYVLRLPPTWIQPAAAGLRLALIATGLVLLASIILVAAARSAPRAPAG